MARRGRAPAGGGGGGAAGRGEARLQRRQEGDGGGVRRAASRAVCPAGAQSSGGAVLAMRLREDGDSRRALPAAGLPQ